MRVNFYRVFCASFVACVTIQASAELFAQDFSWGSPSGNIEWYEIRIDDTTSSRIAKFAGTRMLEFTLGLRFGEPRDSVVPILVRVERYAAKESDGQGFSMSVDTTKDRNEDDVADMHSTAVALSQRLYPVGIESNLNIVRFADFSTASDLSLTFAEQFETDFELALSTLLVPLDGSSNGKPHSWKVSETWDELRDSVPLSVKYSVMKLEGSDVPPNDLKSKQIARIEFEGGGKRVQEGDPAFTATVNVKGAFRFQLQRNPNARTLMDLNSTETLKTDDAFSTSRTRTSSINRLDRERPTFSQEERQLFNSQQWEFSTMKERTITP